MQAVNRPGMEYEKNEQLGEIESVLIRGERLLLVCDCKGAQTGHIGLTNRRLLFQDNRCVHDHPAITSVPFSAITAVTVESSGRVLKTSKLAIMSDSDTYEFEFRSARRAREVYGLILRKTCLRDGSVR